MKLVALALVASACTPLQRQVAAEAAFATVTILDWGQTVGISQRCSEGNPLLGRCGDGMPPGLYFPAMIAVHAVAAFLLPDGWRELFQGLTTGVEAKTVWRNWTLGDRVTF